MNRRLPIAPRPYDDELLSSWQGRIACRYGVTREAVGRWIGLTERLAAPRGFAATDYAPEPEVLAAWSRACRLDPARIENLALQRSRRALDRYVWAHEADGAFVGHAVCPACLEEDAAAGRDQYFRRRWLQVETLVCARHDLLLVEGCWRCGAREGFRFVVLDGMARLACRHRGALVVRAAANGNELSREAKAVLGALGAREPDEDAMATARLLWSTPCPGMAPRPLIFHLIDDPPAVGGAPRDRNAPLSTASLGWRIETWIGVAQLLDLAGAREVFGPARFTIDQLKSWTRPEQGAAAIAGNHSIAPGGGLSLDGEGHSGAPGMAGRKPRRRQPQAAYGPAYARGARINERGESSD